MTRLRDVRHVKQQDTYGCVIASLAMISGLTYEEVAAEYPWFRERNGCDLDTVSYDFLWRHGFAWQQVYPYRPDIAKPEGISMDDWRRDHARDPWPPKPWAPAHLCQVVVRGGSGVAHCVVMLADGSVLDPLNENRNTLQDYECVHNARGLWDVRA